MALQFTIIIESESKEDMGWVWEAMKSGKHINGIKINAMTNGDMFKRLDLTEQQLDLFDPENFLMTDEDFDKYKALTEAISSTFERDI